MKKATIAGGAFATVVLLLVLAAGYRALDQAIHRAATSPAVFPTAPEDAHQSLLYGRITTLDGLTYEGRLRWGGDEEAFWTDYFNGAKRENPWVAHVPPEQLPRERRPFAIFGFEIAPREHLRMTRGRNDLLDLFRIELSSTISCQLCWRTIRQSNPILEGMRENC